MSASVYAATWRDADQQVVASVYGGTACQAPRSPRSLAAITEDGGYEAILRCRDCCGCRRYEKLLLQRRLAAHYQEHQGDLWEITLTASQPWRHPFWLSPSLMRRLPSCAGMIRRGLRGLVLIAEARPNLPRAWLSTRGLRADVKKIARSRGARGFAACTSGLMVPRSEYGRDTNRWYVRGLKPLPRETFTVERKGGIRKRHPEAKQGLRAWRDGLTLYASQKTSVAEWLKAMRSWRSQRLEHPYPNRAPRGARWPSSYQVTNGIAAAPSPQVRGGGGVESRRERRARAASSFPTGQIDLSQSGRDASSKSGLPAWAADFVTRMTKLARERGP